jgi:polar amino acid transport system substrate-binding protein
MKRLTRRTGFWAIGALAFGLVVAGCSAPTEETTGSVDYEAGIITTTVDEAAAALVPDAIREAGVLNVAIDIPYGSLAFYNSNNEMVGLDPDLGRLIAQKLDLEPSLNKQAFDSVIASLQAGKNDIILSGMNDTLERQATLNFVEYLYGGFALIVAEGNPDGINSVEDLCGKTAGIQKATSQGDLLQEYSDQCVAQGSEAITIDEFPADIDAQTALRAGKTQAYVADAVVAIYAAETTDEGNAFDVVPDPNNPNGFNPLFSGVGILNTDQALTDAVFAAMKSLIDEGSYLKVLNLYGLGSYAVDTALMNASQE